MVDTETRVQVENITVQVVEVIPYRDVGGKTNLLVGYKIIDKDFVSPVAHIWGSETDNWNLKLKQAGEHYLDIAKRMKFT